MKYTLKQALSDCEALWTLLERAPYLEKHEALKALGLPEMTGACPCCRYVQANANGSCEACPLRDCRPEGYCMGLGSTYLSWSRADRVERPRYARKIAAAAAARLKELEDANVVR